MLLKRDVLNATAARAEGSRLTAIGVLALKTGIPKLKELGLTESLEVGYRLSPRGWAVLAHLEDIGWRA